MSLRVVVAIVVIATAGLAYFAWNKSSTPAPEGTSESAPQGAVPEMGAPEVDPGVAWDSPVGWGASGADGMRLATYQIPGTGGADPAECAVYYFGPGQGGGVEANLQRWIGEFKDPGRHSVSKSKADGIAVSRLDVRGTYLAHAMSAEGAGRERPDWALLGAIAEGPNGDIFFKLAGPSATVQASSKDFDAMLRSLRRR